MASSYCTTAASPSGRPDRRLRVVVASVEITKDTSVKDFTEVGKPQAPSRARAAMLAQADQAAAAFRQSVASKFAEVLAAVKASSNVR